MFHVLAVPRRVGVFHRNTLGHPGHGCTARDVRSRLGAADARLVEPVQAFGPSVSHGARVDGACEAVVVG